MSKVGRSLLGICAFLFSFSAQAEINFYWDCYLPEAHIECSQLKSEYKSRMGALVAEVDRDLADVVILLRSTRIDDGTEYTISLEGLSTPDDVNKVVRIPYRVTPSTQTVRLNAILQIATANFLTILEPGSADEEGLKLIISDQDLSAPREDDPSEWYLQPSLSFNASNGGAFTISASAGVNVNWTELGEDGLPANWRVQGGADFGYNRIAIETEAGEQIGEVFSFNGYSVVSYTISGGWSVAAMVGGSHLPQENFDVGVGGAVGVEWQLVPYKTVEEKSFAARYKIGPRYHNYSTETLAGKMEEWLGVHSLEIEGGWHFDRVDIGGGVELESPVDDYTYADISGGVYVTIRITDDLKLSLHYSNSYRENLVNEPKELDFDNPAKIFAGASTFNKFRFFTYAALTYTFGNSSLANRDQRWK